MTTSVQERLTAIAEPTRFRIVELLRQGPHPVGAIVDALGTGQPQVSRHLRVLADAGVVTATRHGQQRRYALAAEPLHGLQTWIATFADVWSDRFDRLDAYLTETSPEEP